MLTADYPTAAGGFVGRIHRVNTTSMVVLLQPVLDISSHVTCRIVLLEDPVCPREDNQLLLALLPMTAMRDMCADSLSHTAYTYQVTYRHI